MAKTRSNSASRALDTMSALEIATLMNQEDARVAAAVRKVLPQIARAIDIVAGRLANGGRLIYVGAGTSGRIGALDASECPPTFNTDPRMVQYLIAGGRRALAAAAESKEDSTALGRRDMAGRKPNKKDVVVGLAASGRTPYTVAALEHARKKHAATIAIVCVRDSPLANTADIAISIDVGSEVLSGSTRLKAGTAEKMVCNMLTTGAMARLGYVYEDLMVNVRTNSAKLRQRGIDILIRAANTDRASALTALNAANMEVPVALVLLKAGISVPEARRRLKAVRWRVREAVESVSK